MILKTIFLAAILAVVNMTWASDEWVESSADSKAMQSITVSSESETAFSDEVEIDRLEKRMYRKAEEAGAEIREVDISQAVSVGDDGVTQKSCTASATTDHADIGELSLSASAPTCSAASAKIIDEMTSLATTR